MTPFDRLADKYDRWYETPFGRSAYELELSCLRSLTGSFERGLEIGVGTGRFASALGVEFGADPSYEMLTLAKGRGIKGVQGVGESLPFKDESFDLVLIVISICFVKDPFVVLGECKRVLKEGGRLVLGFIPKESKWADFYLRKAQEGHPIYKHAQFYPFEKVKEWIKRAGFSVERVRSTLLEEPQDKEPIRSSEVVEGFDALAGFTCVSAHKL